MRQKSHKPSYKKISVSEDVIYKETMHEENKTRIFGSGNVRL